MTDNYTQLRAALDAVPCVKWTASRATVHIPETGDWAGKDLCITGLDKQVGRALARYIADAGPATTNALLADYDRLREALEWTAAALQAACRMQEPVREAGDITIVGKTRTIGAILDAADAALAQEQS